ncbi:aldehyde dehydrogenase (NADP(+)) [Micromonospora sicca]|uniref:2,5-dioxovalerate dehydrogenase n=1 Tax=Micromonospora sicca TaxID=2202420 RepID=A0A317CX41_9ACTN|nr:aldehyde dehydrogenase (NADP(+)) [Micromonospora sp. 4G51]PWR06997.1 aldehyde dehydrogenase (NADP(+)) [Micromonospora sp. 4G51]
MTSTDASPTRVDPALTGAMLIGGSAVHGGAGEVRAVDPRTGSQLEPSYGLGGAAEVDRAAELAWAAFDSYRHTDLETRAAFLETIAANIESLGDALIDRVQAETGIPAARVLGERARTCNQLRLFASVVREGSWLGVRIDPAQPDRTPLPRPDIRQRRIPLGPVAVFGASNFPLAFSVAGGDTASALAAGAPVVVKAHEAHPGTSELVGRAIQAAVRQHRLPEGTFSLLFGDGPGLGAALVRHPRIKAVGFTGSRTAGSALVVAAAARPEPIPVYAEMSSVNPVIVLPGALAAKGAELGMALIASVTTGVGQLCTSPGLVFLPAGDGFDEFVTAAADAVCTSPAAPMLTAGICAAFTEGVDRLAAIEGVTAVARGAEDATIASAGRAGIFVTNAATFLADPTLHEEIFGAVTVVVQVTGSEQLREVVQRFDGQLTATVHAAPGDHDEARRLLPLLELKAGRVLFNGWPTGVEVGHAVVHGGPFPATSDSRTTSVGTLAIDRFLRPVSYQNIPAELLPADLADDNPLDLPRRVDGRLGRH